MVCPEAEFTGVLQEKRCKRFMIRVRHCTL